MKSKINYILIRAGIVIFLLMLLYASLINTNKQYKAPAPYNVLYKPDTIKF